LAIALGDVAGKGVPAALLMARLCSEVRYSLLTTTSAAEAATLLNEQLTSHLRTGRFITLILMVLDTQRHEVHIVNAGHSPPLLREAHTKSIRTIGSEEADIPLGINADVQYRQVALKLAPGSLLLFYTDGVNEALSPSDEAYGNERVRSLLATAPDDAVYVGRALVADVRRFAGGRRQSDDICVIAFGRTT
jgi:serine phosphatase RsbU (regulator of sigma subunit)